MSDVTPAGEHDARVMAPIVEAAFRRMDEQPCGECGNPAGSNGFWTREHGLRCMSCAVSGAGA